MSRFFEVVSNNYRKYPNKHIQLPQRATQHSAGYDFYSPDRFIIAPQQIVHIYTDVKVKCNSDEMLLIFIRSSVGIKLNCMLCNCVGVIDSDYYNNPDNDGNIIIPLFNYGHKTVYIKEGDRLAQGIFTSYYISDNDMNIFTKRLGGVGSTNGI
mgnify:CR=1 FL=1